MKLSTNQLFLLMTATITLTSCSSHMARSTQASTTGSPNQIALLSGAPVANTGSVAGSHEAQMDELDRSKLYHALDGGLGKATSWHNISTGIEYTVVPTEKVTINGNSFCRKYSITTERAGGGGANEMTGTACVSSDGAWHPA